MKILICSNYYPPAFIGGAEIIAHYQAKALQRLGHSVIVFAGDVSGQTGINELRRDIHQGVEVYRVGLNPERLGVDRLNFFDLAVENHFRYLLDERPIDVVHLHNVVGLSVGLIRIARERRVKTVITMHDHWGICLKNTLLKTGSTVCGDTSKCFECLPYFHTPTESQLPIRLRKDFLSYELAAAETVISPSHYLAKAYIEAGIPVGRLRVVRNGIDVGGLSAVVKKTSPSTFRFTYIGHLGEHKGVDVLLDAFMRLPMEENVRLNIVGDGEIREQLESSARHSVESGRIRFHGRVENARIGDIFAETDAYVLPSIWPENQPVTITEALACGTPVIASRVGGIPEIVNDGVNGRLVPPGDRDALSSAMHQFATERALVTKLAANCHSSIARYTFDRQVESLQRIYMERDCDQLAKHAARFDILCLGDGLDARCRNLIMEIDGDPRYLDWRLLWAHWLPVEQWKRSHAIWVVDRSESVTRHLHGEILERPWVVPIDNAAFKDIREARKGWAGYRRPGEALTALATIRQGGRDELTACLREPLEIN